MLFDPKWNKEFSAEGFAAWLAAQDAAGKYDYGCAACAVGQYMESIGTGWTEQVKKNGDLLKQLNWKIARQEPWTFGAAAERAREYARSR